MSTAAVEYGGAYQMNVATGVGISMAQDVAIGQAVGVTLGKAFGKFAAKRAATAAVGAVPVVGTALAVGYTVYDVFANHDEYAELGEVLWKTGSDVVGGWFGDDQEQIAAETGVLDTATGQVTTAAAVTAGGIGSWKIWSMFSDKATSAPEGGQQMDMFSEGGGASGGGPDPDGKGKGGWLSDKFDKFAAKSKWGKALSVIGAAGAVVTAFEFGQWVMEDEEPQQTAQQEQQVRYADPVPQGYESVIIGVLDSPEGINKVDAEIFKKIETRLENPLMWIDDKQALLGYGASIDEDQFRDLFKSEVVTDLNAIIMKANSDPYGKGIDSLSQQDIYNITDALYHDVKNKVTDYGITITPN